MRSPQERSFAFLALLALVLAGMAQSTRERPQPVTPNPKLRFAFARDWNGCGPMDEPQSGMTLTPVFVRCSKIPTRAVPPYINVQFDPGAESAPVKVRWVSGKQSASAQRCLREGVACDAAIGGAIDFGDWRLHHRHPETYELQFADGSVEKGTFTSHLPCSRVTCW